MPRRLLLIDAHPDPDAARFCHALGKAYADAAGQRGHDIRLRRLADTDVPMLRTRREWEGGEVPPAIAEAQEDIAWAQHIVLIYPLWLAEPPALLKAFLEQTLRPGFAFSPNGSPLRAGRLRGRSARVVVTMGMPGLAYRLLYRSRSLDTLTRNILGFVGIGPTARVIVGAVETLNERQRVRWLDLMSRWGRAGS